MSVKRPTVWSSDWFSIEAIEDDARTHGGQDPYFGIVAPDSVGIVPITPDGKFVFVRQFRPTIGRKTIELPAGIVDPIETPYQAAERELEEETGMTSARLLPLGSGTLMASRFSNRLTWYLALEVVPSKVPASPELEVIFMTTEDIRCRESDLIADQLLSLGMIALAKAKYPNDVPTVW